MFDVSFSELALVGVIALLVIGPEKLPGVARTAGKWIGKTRRMVNSVKAEVDRELKTDELRQLFTQQQAEVQELRQLLDENRVAIETDIKQLSAETTPHAAPTTLAPEADPIKTMAKPMAMNSPQTDPVTSIKPGP